MMEDVKALKARLGEAATSPSPDTEEISGLIEQIDLRVGAEGLVRKRTVSHLFQQILNTIVPSHLKYLVWSIEQEVSPFNTGTAAKKKSS